MTPQPGEPPTPISTPLAVLAIVGLAIASYLAAYQLKAISTVWEPIFGNGSEVVLHSSLARALPIPDAALGALGYLVEIVCVVVRPRASKWIDVVYKIIVFMFAAASIGLIALQGSYYHAWCTLCLLSALVSFVIASVVWREQRWSKQK